MRKLFLLLLICIGGASALWASIPLYQPVRLQYDTTTLYLSDFLISAQDVKSIVTPRGMHFHIPRAGLVQLYGTPENPVTNLRIITTTDTFDMVCFKSKKIACTLPVFRIAVDASTAQMKGSFNGWVANRNPLKRISVGAFISPALWLNEGYHPFKIEANGKEYNPAGFDTLSNGMGGYNAVIKAGYPEIPAPVIRTETIHERQISISLSADVAGWFCYWNNRLLPVQRKNNLLYIPIPDGAIAEQRSHIRVFAYNHRKSSNDLLIPLRYGKVIQTTSELTRSDFHNRIMYFIMVDRFADGNTANNRPLKNASVITKADFMGGDVQGITATLQKGFFQELGINTLWVSPLLKNPEGPWGLWNKGIQTKFSGYHGYWPVSYSEIDSRFGDSSAVQDLLNTAHAHQINVLLDYVAHHVHQEHPFIQQYPDAATPMYLPDGRMNTELWDEYRLTTWFDTFLPTLNLENDRVRQMAVDSAMALFRKYPFDGFRHDATKHVPEAYWRDLTFAVRSDKQLKGASLYQIGETYGSPELIGSYVGNGLLDAQFDFNLYDAAVAAFARTDGSSSFASLAQTLKESTGYYGWHHLMGNISGNQDRPRFTSLADGSLQPGEDMKLAGYIRKIENKSPAGFKCMAQLMAFNFAIPGIPVIYYGDELGMPGANDPDNRSMMQFAGLSNEQIALRDQVKKMATLRKTHMAMLYGETDIWTSDSVLILNRHYFNDNCLIIFSHVNTTIQLPVRLPAHAVPHFGHLIQNNTVHLSAGEFEMITY